MFKEELIYNLKLLWNTEEDGLSKSLYEATITLIPTPEKEYKKLQINYSNKHKYKSIKQILTNQIQQYFKKIIQHDQMVFIPVMQHWLNIHKSINVIHHINKIKHKNQMIITIDAASDKVQH